MKPFLVYTGLRLALLVCCYGVFVGGWAIVGSEQSLRDQGYFISFIAAALVSSVLSLKLLRKQRDAFAARVDERATRATQRFEELRSAEDSEKS